MISYLKYHTFFEKAFIDPLFKEKVDKIHEIVK
jgi:hypothetical protein